MSSHHDGAAQPRRVEDHLDDILSTVTAPAPVELALLDAHGLLSVEDVTADAPLPAFDNSAMDGYAVRAADIAGASEAQPVRLPVTGEIAAGPSTPAHPSEGGPGDMPNGSVVGSGHCVRIMTGAPIPAGADTVVPVEWTDGGVRDVEVRRSAPAGTYVRRAGDDITAGTVALTAGTLIGPAQVGLLAAVGRERVLVRPRPRVVVLSTGSELVAPGTSVGPGQIVDSNSFLLAAAAREAGGQVRRAGIVPDDRRQLLRTLEEQLPHAELIVTSGGVSMGAYDVVKEALRELGTVRFTRVAMQPGMPQGFGTLGDAGTPILCLPGNPVSALVSFEVFVRPAIRRMLGRRRLFRRTVTANTLEPMSSPSGRRQYRRGRLHRQGDGSYTVRPVGGPGSHLLASLARSNCLIVVDEEVTDVAVGHQVTAIPLLSASL